MPFRIIRNDITRVKADAIVNTANPKPRIGRGTDSAIYAAAGAEELLEARRAIGDIAPGQVRETEGFQLDAKFILHTVGPEWIDGNHGERETLRACYANTLARADELKCRSIAFPLIASGIYGFPKGEALHIALSEIQRFLLTHEMTVTIVVFDRKALELSESLVGGIEQLIDDRAAGILRDRELGASAAEFSNRRGRSLAEERDLLEKSSVLPVRDSGYGEGSVPAALPAEHAAAGDMAGKSLDEVLSESGESFQQRLFRLIDESGMDDVTVYKKANIDRKVFSRIRCRPDYRPKKKTAVAFAIALRLDVPTMTDLLSRAGIAFSPSDPFDRIILYCVTNSIYDIYEINAALFKYGQPILGE